MPTSQKNNRYQTICKKPKIMEYLAELVTSQFEDRAPAPIPEGITFEELEKIAHESHMDYLILGSLIKLSLPEECVGRIRPYIIQSTMKTLAQVKSAQELQNKFEEAGIRNQVLKGSIMKFIYPRPEMREMSDVDFMVYEDDFTETEKLVTEMGFEKYKAIKHHVIFKKPPFLAFEMHWSLYEQTVDKEQYLYYKNQFRAVLKEGCQYTYEFSKEDFYVYMISHMAKHFYENGCGIRNLLDIYVYLNKYGHELDRAAIEKELKICGLTRFEHHVVRLANIWMNKEESTEFYNELFLYMLNCGIYGKGENGIWAQLAKQSKDKNSKVTTNKKLSYYFPSANYMKEYYPWLEGKTWLLPVAWFCRGIHGVTNKDSMDRSKMLEDTEKTNVMMSIYEELDLNFTKE